MLFRNVIIAMLAGLMLTACQYRPLHGDNGISATSGLSGVSVSQIDSRVGQQVRNHLLFLLNGGNDGAEKTHEARLRVTWFNKQLAQVRQNNGQVIEDSSAGIITVIANYDLIDKATGKSIAKGSRQAEAKYDRTGQVFANTRAERDAENRAAKESAEALRLAIASALSN